MSVKHADEVEAKIVAAGRDTSIQMLISAQAVMIINSSPIARVRFFVINLRGCAALHKRFCC